MGRMNWSRTATRDRMWRHGVEDVKGKMPFVAEPPKTPTASQIERGRTSSANSGRIPCLARGPSFQR